MDNISTLKYLIVLLKRDTPMKTLCRDLQYQANGKPVITGLCPRCAKITWSKDEFCSECGQRLDWSDEE